MKISSTTALLFLSVSAASALPGSYNKPTSTADWGYGKYEATTTADSYNAVKTHHVTVGGKESYSGLPILRYNPEVVFADPGDVVLFDFLANNHTVTESTFDSPCQKKSFGDVFASGFRPNFENTPGTVTFEYKVVDTVPHWVYCGQKLPNPHCQAGMVFAINPPKEGPNTFEAFLEKAKAAPLDAPTAAPLDARAAAPDHHSHKTIPVQVGGKPSRNAAPVLRYNPQTVHARAGDMVEFNFRANAHTVTQSSFEKPCEALKGGFKTGLQTNTKDIDRAILKQFKVADDKKPLWFYCGAPTHCQKGMVFAINDGGRFHEFQQRAMASAPK